MSSSFTSRGRRKGNYVPKKVDKGGKGKEVVAEVDIGNKIPIVATFDLDFPNKYAYANAIKSVSNAFLQNREFGTDFSNILVYERYTYGGVSVFALLNRQEVKLLAVITGESGEYVVVLVDKEEFEAVGNFLKEEEGLVAAQFLYYTTPAEYPLENVSFRLDVVRHDIRVLSELNEKSVKIFDNTILFARIYCLFVIPAIVPEWMEFFSALMDSEPAEGDDDEPDVIHLTEYMTNIWNNWDKVSDFITSGGATQLPSDLKFLDLELAKSELFIIKSADMKTPLVPTILRKAVRSYGTVAGNLPLRMSATRPMLVDSHVGALAAGSSSLSDVLASGRSNALAAGLSSVSDARVAGRSLVSEALAAGHSSVPDARAGGRSSKVSRLLAAGPLLVQRISKFLKKIP